MVSKIIQTLKKAPGKPGIYLFKNKKDEVIYVGKSINLAERLKFYIQNFQKEPKITALVNQTEKVQLIKVDSEIEALLLEINLIKKFRPRYNVVWRDDKRPIYIRLTKELLSRVTLSRKVKEANVELFGPFPSVYKTKLILKFLRKIFPFCSCKRPKKPCLFSHLGLCQPSPAYILKTKSRENKELIKQYQENIKFLKMFLSARIKEVLKALGKKMKHEAIKENFEKAADLRDKLDLLKFLIQSKTNLDHYLSTPQIFLSLGKAQNWQLKKLLGLPKLERIEGYDVANLKGKYATGSMVVFWEGLPTRENYRRFKIKATKTPDDTVMLAEVVQRRLKHSEWHWPDLILVDGGKGQVSAVKKALKKSDFSIPVLGLAKRLEEIVLPAGEKFLTYRLSPDSPPLQLLKRVRDEAHRFATTYHKKLHLKYLTG